MAAIDMPPQAPPALVQRANVLPGRHTAPTYECFNREAERNGLDPYVLLAVMKTENGRPGELALNRNGTRDLGVMGVNTVWIPGLAKRSGISESALTYRLASDGCANVAAGASILGQRIAEAGSVWEGVARFHSRNPAKQGPYLKRVYGQFKAILARAKMAMASR